MQYRDRKMIVEGVVNRAEEFTSDRTISIYGDSSDDVERYLRDTPRKWSAEDSRNGSKSENWDLNTGYDKAEAMMKTGWSEGAADLDHRLQAVMPSAGREARFGHSVYGSSVNIGRYLTGQPNNMRRRGKRESGSAPVYHIVVNVVANGNVNANHFKNYGVAIAGLIDRLEGTGKRCHVDVIMVAREQGVRVAVGWNIKQASQSLDLGALAFAIAHPACFRRIGFALIERSPREIESSGYGQSLDALISDLIDPTDGVMIVDGVNRETRRAGTPVGALHLAVEQLNKAAVLAGHATVDDPLIDPDDLPTE